MDPLPWPYLLNMLFWVDELEGCVTVGVMLRRKERTPGGLPVGLLILVALVDELDELLSPIEKIFVLGASLFIGF